MHIIVCMFCIATGMKCTTIMCFNVSVPAPGQVNVVVSGITATSISLSWSVASGSVARSEVVWRETDRGTESSSGSLTGTSYTIDQLESTTIYTVTVRTSNVAGTTDSQLITFSTGITILILLCASNGYIFVAFQHLMFVNVRMMLVKLRMRQ